jgi:hypothetical protein
MSEYITTIQKQCKQRQTSKCRLSIKLDKKEAKMNCLSKSQQSPSLHTGLKEESENRQPNMEGERKVNRS